VLAGAYRENPTPKSLLTHTVIAATDEPLCKRVRADSIVDTYGSDDVNAPSTCPVCLSRDPRFRQA
jgi:hypothetical protein